MEIERYSEEEINEINENNRLKIESHNELKNRERNTLLKKLRVLIKNKELERTANKIILHKFQKEAIDKIRNILLTITKYYLIGCVG